MVGRHGVIDVLVPLGAVGLLGVIGVLDLFGVVGMLGVFGVVGRLSLLGLPGVIRVLGLLRLFGVLLGKETPMALIGGLAEYWRETRRHRIPHIMEHYGASSRLRPAGKCL